ncbi:MAG: hypothetical protein GX170_07255 [Campylobacteraceae bacterium]|nr:hypothetical protein [Campylobacteraceae bacterium]
MRFLTIISMVVWALSAQAAQYINLDGKLALEVDSATIYSGTPVEVLENSDGKAKVKITGFLNEDGDILFATKNKKVALIKSSKDKVEALDEGKGSVTVLVDESLLEEDLETAWDPNIDEFYNTCTQCHAANEPHLHTLLEWDSLYGSMKEFARPTPEQDEMILRFLRSFAKDGFLAFP